MSDEVPGRDPSRSGERKRKAYSRGPEVDEQMDRIIRNRNRRRRDLDPNARRVIKTVTTAWGSPYRAAKQMIDTAIKEQGVRDDTRVGTGSGRRYR